MESTASSPSLVANQSRYKVVILGSILALDGSRLHLDRHSSVGYGTIGVTGLEFKTVILFGTMFYRRVISVETAM